MNFTDPISELRRSAGRRLDPSVRERMRDRVVQEFRRVTDDGSARFTPVGALHQYQPTLMYKAIVATILLALGVATTVAAEGSKPGDPFYRWERGVERVRLSFTVGEAARAKLEAKLAEERTQEFQALEQEHSSNVPAVRAETSHALEQAIETVTEVQQKQEEKGNEHASAELQRVEDRLKNLQKRHLEEDESDQNDSTAGLTEAEAEIRGASTKVKIEFNGAGSEFTVQSIVEADIVQAISDRTGVSEADVRAVLKISREGDDHEGATNGNENRNVPVNGNKNMETNENRNNDESSGETRIKVEVNREDGKAAIETRVKGKEDAWELMTTDTDAILASIVARTGLIAADIRAIWEYKVE